MADHTHIEWTDATWNPIRGCTRVSEGCRHCYAETIAARFSDEGAAFHGYAERGRPGSKWTGKVGGIWPLLDLPLRWREPRRIFVNSMSELFHEALPAEEIATIYAVMVAAVHLRGHTLQVLTKRPARMRAILTDPAWWDHVNAEASAYVMDRTDPLSRRSDDARATLGEYGPDNPPPGIWLGTSVENQAAADERIPHLLSTPATVRFLSCEPLLGPVDLNNIYRDETLTDALDGMSETPVIDTGDRMVAIDPKYARHAAINWVIAGGESGLYARPMHPDWARDLRDQCAAAGVPFFFKQWGEWAPHLGSADDLICTLDKVHFWPTGRSIRLGKRVAGNHLDGRQHLEFPLPPVARSVVA